MIKTINCLILILSFVVFCFGQTQNWLYTYNGPANGGDFASKIVYGSNNNLYTIGQSQGGNSGVDYIVVSLTNAGAMRWIYRYSDIPDALDYGNDIVYGSDGNIYTAGRGFYGNFTLISLNDSGNERWGFHDTVIDKNGNANSVIYSPNNNIYAAGYTSTNHAYNFNFTVANLDKDNGSLKWLYTKDGIVHQWDEATDVVYGEDNNIYACGFIQNSVTHRDFAVVSLTSDSGDQRWLRTYDGPPSGGDDANAIVYGSNNKIYVCGHMTVNNYADLTVMEIDTSGNRNWIYTYGMTNGHDCGFAIVYGLDNNIYVAGRSSSVYNENYDMIVVSLTNSGSERWVYRYSGPGYHWDEAFSLVYGTDGNIYVAGYSWQATGITNFTVISLTNTGNERWVYQHNGPANSEDEAWDVVYGLDGNIYATGYRTGTNNDRDITVISLTSGTGIEQNCYPLDVCPIRADRGLVKIYPNPASSYFVVRFSETLNQVQSDKMTIKIFDVTGKIVRDCFANARNDKTVQISLNGIKNGIYFVKVNDEIVKEKLVVTR